VILIIGSSGVGKSTLLQRSLTTTWPPPWRARTIEKETTRPLRGAAEASECTQIGHDEFARRLESGRYLTHYEIFGEFYGIPDTALRQPAESTLYLQTFPTDVCTWLAGHLHGPWQTKIVLLEAGEQRIRERLLRRGDPSTLRTLEQRVAGVARDRRGAADIVFEADSADQVLDEFTPWLIEQYRLTEIR
jgi:guanylate kinase